MTIPTESLIQVMPSNGQSRAYIQNVNQKEDLAQFWQKEASFLMNLIRQTAQVASQVKAEKLNQLHEQLSTLKKEILLPLQNGLNQLKEIATTEEAQLASDFQATYQSFDQQIELAQEQFRSIKIKTYNEIERFLPVQIV